jgi:hypothetical protein
VTINASQFSTQIVIPTLELLEQQAGIPYSNTAYNLIMGTIAQESLMGTWLVQQDGDALGVGQIEPTTLTGLIASLTPNETAVLRTLATPATPAHNVVGNLPYAVALVRLFYWRIPAVLPDNTVSGLFAYYKQYYNTAAGSATLAQWMQNWTLTGITLAA